MESLSEGFAPQTNPNENFAMVVDEVLGKAHLSPRGRSNPKGGTGSKK